MKRRKKSERQKLIAKADKLCREIVLERDNHACQACGSTEAIQWAHGFSRRYLNVRWDIGNSWALCRRCHYWYTLHPLEWDNWLLEVWGEHLYATMRAQALATDKVDLPLIVADLLAMQKQHRATELDATSG